ncbi:MAG: integron integrase [Planctomycetota bacterium]|nr:integron integrase [Planctomycetota bacterium]MDA1106650.1 integron integrase [Planctomycetota bacterium]
MTLHEDFIAVIRRKHYSRRTERTYWSWIMAFLRFHRGADGWRHPRDLGAAEVESFLTHLAVQRRVAAATQNQALNAVVFLYKQVLELDPGSFHAVRAKPSRRVPTVLSRREVCALLAEIAPPIRMIAELMYGGGLRVGEACAVRVMDVDLDRLQLVVRRGKGDKDRITPLSERLVAPLRALIVARRALHASDILAGEGWVELPFAFERKSPKAAWSLEWQYLFAASDLSRDPISGRHGRWHIHESTVQKAVSAAARAAGITRRVTSHVLRHSFATHLLEDGYDIRTIQTLLGHAHVETTMIYTHVVAQSSRGVLRVRSPLDSLVAVA